jgi:hypothetical protein
MRIVGILAVLIGLLWIGQGTGIINWPQSSFMISQIQWAYYGAALAVVGLIVFWRGMLYIRWVGNGAFFARRAHQDIHHTFQLKWWARREERAFAHATQTGHHP